MTATNIVRLPTHRCVVIVTDGAHYTADGVLRGVGSKVRAASHWPGAITSRGFALPAAIIAHELSCRFGTFDEFVDGATAAIAEFVNRYQFSEWGEQAPEIIAAGWSNKRDRPESYAVNITDEVPPGSDLNIPGAIIPAAGYALQDLPACCAGPVLPSNAEGFSGIRAGGSIDDVVEDLVNVVRAQREYRPKDIEHCFIGGFAELTIIRPTGVEQRVLFRWPDEIGRRIQS